MRVAVVPFEFPVLSETFVVNIVTGLIDRGHQVDIWPLYGPRKDLGAVHPAVKDHHLLKRTFYPPRIAFNDKVLYMPWLLRQLPFLLQRPYDIVHFQFGETAQQCLPLRRSRIWGGKWVVSFRGYDISSYIKKNGDDAYKTLFREGDLFLSNSEFFRKRLIDLGSDAQRTLVYRSGIDCSKFCYSVKVISKDERIRILTVGRLVEKKGIEYTIRAVAHLLKQGMNIEYAVIGDGPLRKSLQELIDGLGAGELIKLNGGQDQGAVIKALQRSHLFIAGGVTAQDGDQNGPDNTIKEAMAMGLPVIASSSGAMAELIEDGKTGSLVPERDVEGTIQQIKHLAGHPELWPAMTRAARSFVEENYNLEKLNDDLVDHYQMLINQTV